MILHNESSIQTDPANTSKTEKPYLDVRWGMQFYLFFDVVVRLGVYGLAFVLATMGFNRYVGWPAVLPTQADWGLVFSWCKCLIGWIILFNFVYAAELLILRVLIPKPREGRYASEDFNNQMLWACLQGVVTKARCQAPFPAFLVHEISMLPPLRRLWNRFFGPNTKSCLFTEPRVLDAWSVDIGRNVVLGINSMLTPHVAMRDAITFRPIKIEDDVVVGVNALIMGGCHLKRGCVVGAGAVVLPNTVIGPYEFWGGVPAKKIYDLRTHERDREVIYQLDLHQRVSQEMASVAAMGAGRGLSSAGVSESVGPDLRRVDY